MYAIINTIYQTNYFTGKNIQYLHLHIQCYFIGFFFSSPVLKLVTLGIIQNTPFKHLSLLIAKDRV